MFVETKEHGEITEAPAKVLDEPAKLLLRAAELIERFGHAKGKLCDDDGRMCVLGAMAVADGAMRNAALYFAYEPSGLFQEAKKRMTDALGTNGLSGWNNSGHRTPRSVVAKLREVALS